MPALLQLDPLWDKLFSAEQARIVQLLVKRVDVRTHGVKVRLRPNGLSGLVQEVASSRRPRHEAGGTPGERRADHSRYPD